MKNPELWFSGALFLALCTVSSGGWLPAAPWCGAVFALLAGGLYWRGFTLSAAEKADAAARQKEEEQIRRSEEDQKRGEQLGKLLNAVQAQQTLLHEEGRKRGEQLDRLLSGQEHTVVELRKAAEQISALRKELGRQGGQILDKMENMQEQAGQRHTAMQDWKSEAAAQTGKQLAKLDRLANAMENAAKQSTEDNGAIYGVLDGTYKVLKQLREIFPENFHDELNQNAEALESAISKLPRKLEELGEDLETQAGQTAKALSRLSDTLEKENREQREWTDNLMQQYAAVTEQDLKLFSSIVGER